MPSALWKRSKDYAGWILLVLLVISVALSIVNSRAVHGISIQVLDAKSEVRDVALPGMGGKSALPDYRIEVMRSSGSRIKLGTIIDSSASEPLHWEIQDPIRLRSIAALRLVEDDKLANDVLEEVQIAGDAFSSERYRYELTIARTASAALDYFFQTPIGLVILGAIGLAIFLWIASHVSWW